MKILLKIFIAILMIVAVAATLFFLNKEALAQYLWERGDIAWALAFGGGDAETAMQIGNYYFGNGAYDLEKAKKAYQQALDFEPGVFWGHYQLARIYFVEGRFKLVLEELEKELEANPGNLRVLYIEGLAYAYRDTPGDLDRSEEAFKRFIKWAPKEWAGYNDLAWVLLRQKKYDETIQTIEAAWSEIPDLRNENPWLLNSYGVAKLNLNEKQEAEMAFLQTQEILETMSMSEWRKAYPGNAPEESQQGFEAFKQAVGRNLEQAKE